MHTSSFWLACFPVRTAASLPWTSYITTVLLVSWSSLFVSESHCGWTIPYRHKPASLASLAGIESLSVHLCSPTPDPTLSTTQSAGRVLHSSTLRPGKPSASIVSPRTCIPRLQHLHSSCLVYCFHIRAALQAITNDHSTPLPSTFNVAPFLPAHHRRLLLASPETITRED